MATSISDRLLVAPGDSEETKRNKELGYRWHTAYTQLRIGLILNAVLAAIYSALVICDVVRGLQRPGQTFLTDVIFSFVVIFATVVCANKRDECLQRLGKMKS